MSSVQGASSRDAGARPTIWSLLPIAASVFLLASLTAFRLRGGVVGDPGLLATPVVALYEFFGFEPAFMGCLLVLTWSSIWFLTGAIEQPANRLLQILTLSFCLAILVNLRSDGIAPPQGGVLGAFFAERLYSVFGFILSTLVVSATTIVMLFRATDSFFIRYFETAGRTRTAIPDPGVETQAVAELQSLELTSSTSVGGVQGGGVRLLDPDVEVRLEPQWRARTGIEEDERERVAFADALSGVAEDDATDGSDEASDPDDDDGLERVALDGDDAVYWESDEPELDEPDHSEPRGGEPAMPLFAADVARIDEAEPETGAALESSQDEPELGPDAIGDEVFDGAAYEDDDGPTMVILDPSLDDALDDALDDPLDDGEPIAEPTVELPAMPPADRGRQARLFGDVSADRELVGEAAELVISHGRASASFLRRRLRISADEAREVLAALARLGVVECDPGDTQARVAMDADAWARSRSAD